VNLINGKTTNNGGAIYTQTNNLKIINTTFTNNTATNWGGAIHANDVNVIGSNFTNNTANNHGGAIYAYDVNVTGSNFTGNTAYIGGAIFTNNNVGVIGSNFTNNTANNQGGAIYAYDVNVIGSNFTGNTANNYDGGAIRAYSDVNVIGSTFINNTAQEYGGAIRANNNVNVTGSNFIGNTANNYGGAICTSNEVNVAGSNFTNNTAKQDAGAIFATNVNVIGSTFTNNTANNYGGAIRAYSDVNVIGSTFTGNTAQEYGGAIYANNDVNVTGSNFTNNTAQEYGGAIYAKNVNVTGSNFTNNTANNQGGAIRANNYVNVTGSTFINNTAQTYNGGAIRATDVNVTGSNFTNNTANQDGGAIYANNVNVTGSNFTNNTANQAGGAISATNNVNVTGSKFTNNTANNDDGGAIYAGNVNVIGSNFTNNTAHDSGGAIIVNNVKVIGSSFTGNTAKYGGAIFAYNDVNVAGSKFINNTANNYGGAIYNYINGVVSGSSFNGNNAIYGVVIFNENKLKLINNDFNSFNIGYLIYNNGLLFLKNNTMFNSLNKAKIYNNDNIDSIVYLDIMGNSTLYAVYNVSVILNATLTDDMGNIIVGQNITLKNSILGSINLSYYINGIYQINYTPNIVGSYLINGSYNGGDNLTINTGILTVRVTPLLNVTVDDVVYGEDVVVYVNLTSNGVGLNGTVIITVNGKNYNVIVTNGKGDITIDKLPANTYILNATYNGSQNYTSTNNTVQFEVSKSNSTIIDTIIDADNIIMFYRDGTRYIAVLTDINGNPLANQTVYITVKGVTYTKVTNENGTVYLTINLDPGDYIVGVYFNGTNNYGNASLNTNLTVFSTIISKDLVKYYRNGSQYHVTILNSQGNPLANSTVSFNINGVFYTRTTNNSGVATLNINLLPGDYIVTVNYDDLDISNNVTVLSTISGEDIVKYYKNGTQYHVTVLDSQGNPLANSTVSFNINGVFYTRTTDSNGVATLSINLNSGDYIITATGADGLKVSNSIKVLSTISGEDIVKDYKNDTHYNATVLDGQGNPLANSTVSFNINGVFYTKITDSNGVATLSINLNPGDYIITATGADGLKVSNSIKVLPI